MMETGADCDSVSQVKQQERVDIKRAGSVTLHIQSIHGYRVMITKLIRMKYTVHLR